MKNIRIKGFTLIELMMVATILGILAAIALPKFADLVRKSNEGAAKGSLGTLRSAINVYYAAMEGLFPGPIDPLTVKGKYLPSIPSLAIGPYHRRNSQVRYSSCAPTPCDVIKKDIVGDNGRPLSYWGYATNANPDYLGRIWISCSHTDARRALWSNY